MILDRMVLLFEGILVLEIGKLSFYFYSFSFLLIVRFEDKRKIVVF